MRLSPTYLAIAGFITSAGILEAQQVFPHRVYVSVEDRRGAVSGLGTADFVVRVGEKDARVLDASPAADPVSIVIVTEGLNESHVGAIRRALNDLAAALRRRLPRSRLGIMLEEGAQPPMIYGVVDDAAVLDRAIRRFYKSGQSAPLLESLLVATDSLTREPNPRRVVLAITLRGKDSWIDTMHPQKVADALRDSRTALWSIDYPMWDAPTGSAEERVLVHATRHSGGKRQTLLALNLEVGVRAFAELLLSQYAVSYEYPSTAEPGPLRVGVRRDNVSVYAPGWTATAAR